MNENLEPRAKNPAGPSGSYTYRNLIVWQKAQGLALAIIQLIAELPGDRAAGVIANQIMRSSSSIGANIAEGHGRYAPRAHANYLSIAKASACETDSFLDLLKRAGYLNAEREAELHGLCVEVIRMLTSKIIELDNLDRRKAGSPRIGEERAAYGTGDNLDETVLGSGF